MRKWKMEELGRLSTASFKAAEKLPLVVILDNVRSGMNVGSVFRTADSFLLEAIYICGYAAQPPHRDVLKTALGATETVEWKYFEHTKDAIQHLQEKQYKVYAVEQVEGAVHLPLFKPDEKMALVFGNEVSGVEEEVLDICNGAIEVPQWGKKHSLNISVCAGIVIWEVSKKMRQL